MDGITERVGESSRRTRPKQSRKSLAESPPSQLPKSSQKKRKRKRETLSGKYYSVRQILDEKTIRDEISYLIDWEDNPDTGESYTPTWV
jgi:hypothetical protein